MNGFARNLLLSLILLVAGPVATGASARDVLPEYILKTGYLYNFALLTQWPEDMDRQDFEICFYGHEDIADALSVLKGKTVDGRPVIIRPVNRVSEVKDCRMLFLASTLEDDSALLKFVRETVGQPILTVTDDERLQDKGPAIFLRPDGSRLVFEVDQDAVARANLVLSSRLLRLAKAGGMR